MTESVGYYTMFGPGESTEPTSIGSSMDPILSSFKPPSLVEDPSFSGGYGFESYDPSTGDPLGRHPVDWGSLKTVDYSAAEPSYRRGAVMLSSSGEIFENKGYFESPEWESVGSLYGSSVWSDPSYTGGALSGSLPTYTAPSTPLFSSTPSLGAGMYSTGVASGSTAPVYHSVITGTFDPTSEEIVAAVTAGGYMIPPGVDPIEYSMDMSGVPYTPSPVASPVPATSTPAASSIPTATPTLALPTIGSSLPTSTTTPGSVGASTGISGSPLAAAMKALSPSFGGGGGLLCDPITGKCPQYR